MVAKRCLVHHDVVDCLRRIHLTGLTMCRVFDVQYKSHQGDDQLCISLLLATQSILDMEFALLVFDANITLLEL